MRENMLPRVLNIPRTNIDLSNYVDQMLLLDLYMKIIGKVNNLSNMGQLYEVRAIAINLDHTSVLRNKDQKIIYIAQLHLKIFIPTWDFEEKGRGKTFSSQI